jgi:hypothetical protein
MKNFRLLSYFLIAAMVWNCAPKAAKKATGAGQYEEDLSGYRPKYELPQKTTGAATTNTATTNNPADFGKDSDNVQVEEKMAAIREKNKGIKYTQGYRIQIYSGNSQEAAEKAKETVYRLDANLDPEVIYFTPNFKVKVGNYYDRVEAYETLVKIRQAFPQALLLPERVSIK